MRQLLKFQFKFLKLTALERSRLKFIELVAEPLLITPGSLKSFPAFGKLALQRKIFVIPLLIAAQKHPVPCKHIKHTKLVVPVAEQQVLMLRVYINEPCPYLLEKRDIHRGIVYERPAPAACGKLAAYYALPVVIDVILLEKRLEPEPFKVEETLYDAAVSTLAYSLHVGTLSKKHGYGAEKYRLSMTGLSCNYRKACREFNLDMLDKREVAYGNMLKHLNYYSLLSCPTPMRAKG